MRALRLPRLSSLRAFEHPGYFAVWVGALVSTIGTWMETVAMGVYVTEATGRAEWTGGIVALTFLPAVVLSPVGGALADRFDRRAYVALGTVVQLVLAGVLTLLAFTHRLSVPVVGVISFVHGCASTLINPAFSAMLAELVPPRDLHSAMSLNSAQFNLGRIIGPALAALVLSVGGTSWALLVNTLSFVAVLVALSQVKTLTRTAARATQGLWKQIAHGFSVARGDSEISLMLWGTLLSAGLVAPFIGLVPVFAIRVFGQGAAATSLLVTCQGVGAVTAALLVGTLVDTLGQRRLLGLAATSIGGVATLYWLSPTLQVAAAVICVLGANYMMLMSGMHAYCQSRVPRELQARMSSLFSMVLGGAYAAGVWGLGALADRLGLRFVTVSASVLFLALVLTLRLLRPRRFDGASAEARVRG
ncbi:MFS transporter [Corallococcus macrosporus]|uniref:MFS transporter n=1 Tax=Corallococcus macrosporus DSM 14697 TaxID=1189310 RepID=A0A250JLU1_9BACT|nr:MFS transporter [Corallococcus macrosporus]ATB44442.1 MFS transporter [Corallococcus macrosporus DSM 14697]